ncbi:MAG: DUF4398 domain-containing protein [Deltaproteobacteria bacterium]|nr:DUF4398 domain-containing protein [Deltaproteobacteria bacterium]
MTSIKISLVAASALAIVACGSSAIPADRLARSQAAYRSAQEMGAANNPQAALHLRLAEEQLTTAKALIKDGENERADSVLRRAEADANLALDLARSENARTEATKTMEQVQKAKQAAQMGGK